MHIHVALEPAVRLMGTLLAAGDWPLAEQAAKAHLAHRSAEQTRRALADRFADPLVVWANQLAHDSGPGAVLRQVLRGATPFEPAAFSQQPPVRAVWDDQAPEWQLARADLAHVLDRPGWAQPIQDLFVQHPTTVTVVPNLLFPALHAVAADHDDQLVVASPPPLAWGASPPWRYGERPEEALAAVATAIALHLMTRHAPHLAEVQRGQIAVAIAGLVLRDQFGPDAADQYVLIEKRTRKWPGLPTLVAALMDIRTQAPTSDWIARVP